MLRTAMTTQATARPADAARRPKNRPCSSEGSGFPAQPVLACYPLGRRRELRRLGSAAVGALLRRLRLGELAVDVVPVDVAEERLDVLLPPVRGCPEVAGVGVLIDVQRQH